MLHPLMIHDGPNSMSLRLHFTIHFNSCQTAWTYWRILLLRSRCTVVACDSLLHLCLPQLVCYYINRCVTAHQYQQASSFPTREHSHYATFTDCTILLHLIDYTAPSYVIHHKPEYISIQTEYVSIQIERHLCFTTRPSYTQTSSNVIR